MAIFSSNKEHLVTFFPVAQLAAGPQAAFELEHIQLSLSSQKLQLELAIQKQ